MQNATCRNRCTMTELQCETTPTRSNRKYMFWPKTVYNLVLSDPQPKEREFGRKRQLRPRPPRPRHRFRRRDACTTGRHDARATGRGQAVRPLLAGLYAGRQRARPAVLDLCGGRSRPAAGCLAARTRRCWSGSLPCGWSCSSCWSRCCILPFRCRFRSMPATSWNIASTSARSPWAAGCEGI